MAPHEMSRLTLYVALRVSFAVLLSISFFLLACSLVVCLSHSESSNDSFFSVRDLPLLLQITLAAAPELDGISTVFGEVYVVYCMHSPSHQFTIIRFYTTLCVPLATVQVCAYLSHYRNLLCPCCICYAVTVHECDCFPALLFNMLALTLLALLSLSLCAHTCLHLFVCVFCVWLYVA